MSLQVDGVWKAGVWASTVWASNVWYESGVIGRKYPRHRGRYKPRYEEVIARINEGDADVIAKEYAQKIIEQAREIASARTDLEIAQRIMKRGKDKVERLAILEARVSQAEDQMAALMDEEELMLVLALAIAV